MEKETTTGFRLGLPFDQHPVTLTESREDLSVETVADTDDHGLREAFSPHGKVTEATVVTDRGSGRSRGFGFVTFADDGAAAKAVAALNQTELDGRTIKVDVAHDRDRDRPSGRPSSSRW